MNAISAARDQLQGALQAAGSKKRDSEWDSSDDEDNLIDIQDVSAPARVVKKRRRKEVPEGNFHDTYVMKLFDRSVNLAQFAPGTPLYPVCRAWIANDPNKTTTASPTKQLPDAEAEEEGDQSELVFSLPRPTSAPLQASGRSVDLRIPSDIRPPALNQLSDLQPSMDAEAPNKTALLSQHLVHWRGVRNQWRAAATANEQRYADSFRILSRICVPDS